MKRVTFPHWKRSDWEEKCALALKGRPLESLTRSTYEGIKLKPLYFPSDQDYVCDFPGEPDFRRGSFAHEPRTRNVTNLLDVRTLTAFDPLSLLASTGYLMTTIDEQYDKVIDLLEVESDHDAPRILVDTSPYHNGGASAVQELAVSLALAVTHLENLINKDVQLTTILSGLVFEYSIGSNFFMEIAKLRAARMVWSKVAEAYGATPDEQRMMILARTSHSTKTLFDPYVNLLRAGNEAFAAIIGGAQYLHVSPYTEPSGKNSSFSERIAQNTKLILIEEAWITQTTDPAGGSWFIEELTDELAEQAWQKFLEIDAAGGLLEMLRTGRLQQEIEEVRVRRETDIFTRKQTIIGTNMYANLQEEAWSQCGPMSATGSVDNAKEMIHAIPQRRLAESFEQLRFKAQSFQKAPTVGLICLGELKQFKSRADFAAGFFATGGIGVKESGALPSIQEVVQYVQSTDLDAYCICGTNEQYQEYGVAYIQQVKALFPQKIWMIAGLPDNASVLSEAGICLFIHVKSNCYEANQRLLLEMEERNHA